MAEPPLKRFRYSTYNEQLRDISVQKGKSKARGWEDDAFAQIEEVNTPLTAELARLSLHDLTLPYQQLARDVSPRATSLPITLLNLPAITRIFTTFFRALNDGEDQAHSGLDSALSLLEALFKTCLGEAVEYTPVVTEALLRVGTLRALDPHLVERTFATLSEIFRLLATPLSKVDAHQALQDTWREIAPCLRPKENKRYIRKCAADAWVIVIRKARGEGLGRLIKLMLFAEPAGLEAVWAHALKGAAGQLHSRSLPVLEVLLDEALQSTSETTVDTLILLLTSLTHHCTAASLEPVTQLLLNRLRSANPLIVRTVPPTTNDRTSLGPTALLRLLSTALLVRKGKRFPDNLLRPTMQALLDLSDNLSDLDDKASSEDWRASYIEAVIAVLLAGKLEHWLNPGIALIDQVWRRLTRRQSFAFASVFIGMSWSGFDQFLMPHIARTILEALETDTLASLTLLTRLHNAGHLNSLSSLQGGRWMRGIVEKMTVQAKAVSQNLSRADHRQILSLILRLIPAVPTARFEFTDLLLLLLKGIPRNDGNSNLDVRARWRDEGIWNSVHLAADILGCILSLLQLSGPQRDDLLATLVNTDGLNGLVESYAWSREMLERMADLSETGPLVVMTARTVLFGSLTSADPKLRSASIRLLKSAESHNSSSTTETQSREIWDACLAVESAEMTLRNSRERPEQIARLGRLLQSIPSSAVDYMQVATRNGVRYLIGQLKVNYRPLYPETVKALVGLVSSHGETLWNFIWEEMLAIDGASSVSTPDFGVVLPEWALLRSAANSKPKLNDEEEKEFRCPSLAQTRALITSVLVESSDERAMGAHNEVEAQVSSERVDVLNYQAQLLLLLGALPGLAEKNTRSLVPMFLAVTGYESTISINTMQLSTRQLQQRTANFLALFAKFVNPKAAFRSDEVHHVYLSLLAKGDNKLQNLALDCLLTYKSPSIVPYAENLRALLDEAKLRGELTRFQLGFDAGSIDPLHRSEAIPVITRIFYGIITARRGRTSAHGLAGRKQAILTAMSACSPAELQTLVDLMLEPFTGADESMNNAPGRQQLGYLSLLQDIIRYLGPQIAEHWPRLLSAVLNMVDHAQAVISAEGPSEEQPEIGGAYPEVDLDAVPDKGSAPLRVIRSTGVKRLVQFLQSHVDFDFHPYLAAIFRTAISPRLDLLEVENTQGVSGSLDLIAAIAANPALAPSLNTADERTLPKVFACLVAPKVKSSVISRVFDIVESLTAPADDTPDGTTLEVLLPHIRSLLDSIILLVPQLKAAGSDDQMRRLLGILSSLATLITDGDQAQQLCTLLLPVLRQPTRQISEKAKVNILLTLHRILAISPDFRVPQSAFFSRTYESLCKLFESLYFPSSRRALTDVLLSTAQSVSTLEPVLKLTADINAYSTKRPNEPDFDRRLTAFGDFNDQALDEMPSNRQQWLPLLYSALFYIREPEELSIRTSASALLQRFISATQHWHTEVLEDMLSKIVLPGLKQTLRTKIELVRNEALAILSHAVKTCPTVASLAHLQPLLGSEDDETNFFVNMAHIQVHRRTRAVRRLRDLAIAGSLDEESALSIFIPLLEHIITGATEVTDHHLINEAILTVGAVSKALRWSKYNALANRHLKLGAKPSPQQKFHIRTVSAIIDNFSFDLRPDAPSDQSHNMTDAEEDDGEDEHLTDPGDITAEQASAEVVGRAITLHKPAYDREQITQVVLGRLLPNLSKFVSQKDEVEDNIRIPVAIGIVKIASALPGPESANEIIRILTTTSQVLRSRDQETRDLARETIGKIAIYLGPEWLVRVLKELRDALQRGPQKHVLAVTTHSILVLASTEATERFKDLDSAVQDAVEISAEVIWGESGKDVEAEGFKTKMREVRGAASRGYDTFQLVSRLASPRKIATILAPLRQVMRVSQSVKAMQAIDEALRRIALGLNANTQLDAKDLLNLCFSLISGNSAYLQSKRKAGQAGPGNQYEVQMKRETKKDEDFYHLNANKVAAFGLDLFITAFKRSKFDFENVDTLSRLAPLVPAICDTLGSTHQNVVLIALKASAAIVRCPLPQVAERLPKYIALILDIIRKAGGTAESETVQTALKTLGVIIRDCKDASIADDQLKYLLEVISPDLEANDRQSAIFALLRAIVSRKFVVPEIYDLMDRVSAIMVTSQSSGVQEQCRVVLIQFLLDYPQGSGRLKNQMNFLAQNLDYVYESGRVSVMELLCAAFAKFSDEVVEEYADLFFVALVMVLANDDSAVCRNMASSLIKTLVIRLESTHRKRTINILRAWVIARDEQPTLAGAALAVLGLLVDSELVMGEVLGSAVDLVVPIISETAQQLREAETDSAFATPMDHQMPHQALVTLDKALNHLVDIPEALEWDSVIQLLLFPHDWVRFDAARILTTLFANLGGATILTSTQMLDVARKCCLLLKGGKDTDGEHTVVDPKLADELVKLLWNIAKHWANTKGPLAIANGHLDQHEADTNGHNEEVPAEANAGRNPLSWLMSRASFLARHLIISRPSSHIVYMRNEWTRPVTSILRFFAGTFDFLDEGRAKHYARHVLAPVYRVLDEDGDLAGLEKDEELVNLRQLAVEVRDFVQSKIGTTDFSQTWESLRKKVREKREGRREVRSKLPVSDPQAWAHRKEKRGEMKKEGKKRKLQASASGNLKGRSTKRRA